MLSWIDLVIILIFAGTVVLETKRGFGRSLFDLAAVLVTVRTAPMVADPLAKTMHISAHAPTNQAYIYAGVFVVTGGLLVLLGKLVYDSTLISAETFDAVLGGLLGVGVAIVLCHAMVRTVALTSGAEEPPVAITQSALGTEFLTFDSYHRLLEVLYNFDRTEELPE